MGQALVGARLVWRRDSDIDPIRYAATLVEALWRLEPPSQYGYRPEPLCALKGILFFFFSAVDYRAPRGT